MIEKNIILENFCKNLRIARLNSSLTQEKLALALEFDRTYIGLLERGKRNPSLVTICKIANFLNIDVSDLIKSL
jgi:transcriptional regulator with XRE-family HTH domain